MEIISRDAFLQWATQHGIGPDPRFSASQTSQYLMFTSGERESRFWEYPKEAGDVPHFVEALIAAVGSATRYWVYPPRGHWETDPQTESWPQGRAWRVLLQGLGLPPATVGAVGVVAAERATLLAMLFLQVTLGPAVYVDSVLIPDDGSAVLFFEHHHVVHAEFRDHVQLHAAIDSLATAGYLLPSELPDATFKPVEWMRPKGK
jgi:hypothetical protein